MYYKCNLNVHFSYICSVMTFRQKYLQLQNTDFVINMITKSVYDTMHLENQGLSKAKIKKMVLAEMALSIN